MGEQTALLGQEGSGIAKRIPRGVVAVQREILGRFEPPLLFQGNNILDSACSRISVVGAVYDRASRVNWEIVRGHRPRLHQKEVLLSQVCYGRVRRGADISNLFPARCAGPTTDGIVFDDAQGLYIRSIPF